MTSTSGKVHPALLGVLFVLCLAAIALTLFITPDSLSVNLVYQAF
ncbi:MAG: hypothetical protein JWQ42_889 [Edaphobacter sp.]|jgi:hypothetical protein|nr:hypothetical protein [Edaphobacter sp.]MCU1318774.1 hypothetical protein [Edaphobacter sp.]